MIRRRRTRTVTVGGVKIGSGHPVVIQSMAKTDASDVSATVGEIRRLEKAGCELVRVAVKDAASSRAITAIKERINIPLIADIHFDYKLALDAVLRGADKIRINPGNITGRDRMGRVIDAAGEKGIPVRLGVNSGSLTGTAGRATARSADIMVTSLLENLEYFRRKGFNDIVVSLKSSDVAATVAAYRKIAGECDYPFHVGITAAGPAAEGIIKSSMGIGALLLDGIGDTIRVSLTGDPVQEVVTAKHILSSAGVRHFGPEVISCPTCGRCRVDLVSMVDELEKELAKGRSSDSGGKKKPLTIAVMGCEVNGPGEAKNADIGIAFGKGKGALFRKGRIVRTVSESDAVRELMKMMKVVDEDPKGGTGSPR